MWAWHAPSGDSRAGSLRPPPALEAGRSSLCLVFLWPSSVSLMRMLATGFRALGNLGWSHLRSLLNSIYKDCSSKPGHTHSLGGQGVDRSVQLHR